MDRRQLADFLRRSRERLRPQEAGLTPGPRRRTPGLRREEVAHLAGMSADYYMRLEQARSPQPSTQLLAALARALRLTDDERDHLYLLAGHRPPEGRRAGEHLRPGVLHLLDRLADTPVQVLNDLGDLLAQNTLADAVFGTVCSLTGPGRNIMWRWFTDPVVRRAYPAGEHDDLGRVHVAELRAALSRREGDPGAADLVNRLREASPEFAALWDRHEVATRRCSRMRVDHPVVGPLDLDWEVLLTPAEDQKLLLFTPRPGTGTAERLDLLHVVGPEQFAASE
ncbi:helix-turn-helix transcriptional regulator [Amycolatopsis magusensis]|uniref:helix-turn-helix transcriptional regulator n=1 Tax=Amycolatopsis magusensis TaxID=882444 RepID=UPI0037A9D8FE